MKLLKWEPNDPGANSKIIELIRACEEIYDKYPQSLSDLPREMFLIEQFGTLLSNLLDNHPELNDEYRDFIDQLKMY